MIDGLRVLGLITARGGSKGLPRKNVRDFCGKPLIAWTIEAAARSKLLDRLILSTDDQEIAEVSRSYGCDVPFMRPAELSGDAASSLDVVRHALDVLPGFDIVVILQPTSPLRTTDDIDRTVQDCVSHQRPCSLTVAELSKPIQWVFALTPDSRLLVRDAAVPARRQEIERMYLINGAVYAVRADWVRTAKTLVTPDTGAVVMAKHRSVDIDDEADFISAVALAQNMSALERGS